MSSPDPTPSRLEDRLTRELLGRVAGYQAAVAERLGLSPADLRCFDHVRTLGRTTPVTAGRLAELTGLTTGAITGVLDRLEREGFVVRERAPEDRRQVRVRAVAAKEQVVEALTAPWRAAWAEACAPLPPEVLGALDSLLAEAAARLEAETARLADPAPTEGDDETSAPLAAHTRGLLDLAGGAWRVSLGSLSGPLLFRARTTGARPAITTQRDGTVSLRSTGGLWSLLSRDPPTVQLGLNRAVPWSIRARGGAARLTGDLSEVPVTGISFLGGATSIDLTLPPPSGNVSIRVDGGVHDLRLQRPAGVPVRIRIDGGATGLSIDGVHMGNVGGELRWESPTWSSAADRYDVRLDGGAAGVVLATR